MIGPLKQRSSWPSSFATGLIGWVGFAIIVPLALGYEEPLRPLFVMATFAAVVQVVVLRLGFSMLKMGRGIKVGALWGGVTAVLIVAGGWLVSPEVRAYPIIAMVTGIYVGIPVGAFLSYFHRDDREIEDAATTASKPIDYGRDAHWLDPFVYGAVAYEVALLPQTADIAIAAAVVGMIVGVVAAGTSHFILSKAGNTSGTIPAAAVAGAIFGAPTGLLFRAHAASLLLPPLAQGAVAGALTFLATAIAGRKLAALERARA